MARMEADKSEALTAVILVGGRTIGYCTAFDEAQGYLEVDLAVPVMVGKGKPGVEVRRESDSDYQYASQRIWCAFDVRTNAEVPEPPPFIYWTGERWIDDESLPSDGPLVVRKKDLN
jgi:hypothetical protein